MRGEDLPPFLFFKIAMETPPHAWGRRLAFPAALHRPGNTPTCVGKTPAPARGHAGSWKHPHMRGEDNRGKRVVGFGSETPPHAWGRLNHAHTELSHGGNTPTCVGKTLNFWVGFQPTRKHPHMRGEDFTAARQRIEDLETPPHAWGRREQGTRGRKVHRNTPTCVGKTRGSYHFFCSSRKHPHMRGEDRLQDKIVEQSTETPPHAWGRPETLNAAGIKGRNTPTCVGKTLRKLHTTGVLKKHPHMRGEDLHLPYGAARLPETPPHAWGRRCLLTSLLRRDGNTPTCVGKTSLPGLKTGAIRKHPHMRGEDPERSLNFFLHTWY